MGHAPAAAFGIGAVAHAKRSLQLRFNPAALLRRCEERAAALRPRSGLARPLSRIPPWRRRGRYLGLPTDAVRRILFSVAAVLCTGAAVAQEQNPAPVQQQQISETQAAALLIQLGRLDEAKLVLVHVLQVTPNDNEAIFLTGLIAVAEKRYGDAVEAFRRILATEPERERVRLELARAFFLE